MSVRPRFSPLFLTFAAALTLAFAGSASPPDSEFNPALGVIETVDATTVTSGYEIRLTTDQGPGQPTKSVLLSTSPLDDLDPRIATDATGGAWVAWWRDGQTDEILLRRRMARGAWSAEFLVSEKGEDSRSPSIAFDGQRGWIAYCIHGPESVSIAVRSGDGAVPWPSRQILHSTYFGGNVEPEIYAKNGKLWVTWIESQNSLGWREYDYATQKWSTTAYESMPDGDHAAALTRVAQIVLN